MTTKEISDRLKPFFKKKNVEKAILFGSIARGTRTRKSDLDLIIILNTEKRFFDRYDEFDEIQNLFKESHVDMLIYTPKEFKDISHRKFIKTVLTEGKTIYER
jgi:predicted nucleotidyltransferase